MAEATFDRQSHGHSIRTPEDEDGLGKEPPRLSGPAGLGEAAVATGPKECESDSGRMQKNKITSKKRGS